MTLSPRRSAKRLLVAGVAAASVTVLAAGTASAENVVITGGLLAMSSPTVGNFAGVTLDGTNKTTTAAATTFIVTDPTGTGAGWHVTAAATQFCSGIVALGACTTGRSLANGSLSHGAPAAEIAGAGSNTTALTRSAAVVDGSSGTIVSAALNTGMGTYTVGASTLTLSVPASAYAGTYVSTLTYTVASTP